MNFRFLSTALDSEHLWAAMRYVEQNPVRAGLVERAEHYPWSSSAAFHLGLRDDRIIRKSGIWGGPVEDWRDALAVPQSDSRISLLRSRTHDGFSCGDEDFVAKVSKRLGIDLTRRPIGRPKKG